MASQLQHYIPRFVLRRFRDTPRDLVYVHDKHAGRCFAAGTGKVAAEKGLYDFEVDGETLTLEPGLAEIEGRAAQHVERVLADGHLHLADPFERGELARFFAIQLVRTPAHATMWREASQRMESYLRKEGMPEEFFAPDPRFGSRENAERAISARIMVQAPLHFGPSLTSKDWVLMTTETSQPYLIGDHPLVMHNARDLGPRGNLGVEVPGIEIYFSLSPCVTLGVMCQSHRRDFVQALQNMTQAELSDPARQKGLSIARAFVRAVETGEPARIEPESVTFLNSLQIARAERFVFSCRPDFALAEEMIRRHPHLRTGQRIEEVTGKF